MLFNAIVCPSCQSMDIVKHGTSLRLKELLEPFGITQYYTDGWGAYERHIEARIA